MCKQNVRALVVAAVMILTFSCRIGVQAQDKTQPQADRSCKAVRGFRVPLEISGRVEALEMYWLNASLSLSGSSAQHFDAPAVVPTLGLMRWTKKGAGLVRGSRVGELNVCFVGTMVPSAACINRVVWHDSFGNVINTQTERDVRRNRWWNYGCQ